MIHQIDYKWQALLAVSIGTYMGSLDASIVNMSSPRLARVFLTDASVVLWVNGVYLLVSVSLMLILGRIADVMNSKKLYCSGLALFTVGLLLCSLSQSISQLILFRIIQGVGTAMSLSISMAIVTRAFPIHERGRALGLLGAVLTLGLFTGPILGGIFLDLFDWRSVFYIRVPLGVLVWVMSITLLRDEAKREGRAAFDLWGAFSLFCGLCCLILFFNLGGRWGFASLTVLLLAAGTILSLCLFVAVEKRVPHPVINLDLFQNKAFASGNVCMVMYYVAVMAFVFLTPFYFIDALGIPPSRVGLLMSTVPLTIAIISPISGWLSDRIDPRRIRTAGIGLFFLSLLLFRGLDTHSATADILVRLVLIGIGSGLFEAPNTTSIMKSVPPQRFGTASAMVNTTRQLGLVIGTAVMGTIYASRQVIHASRLGLTLSDGNLISRTSMVNSFRETVLLAALLTAVTFFVSVASAMQKSADGSRSES